MYGPRAVDKRHGIHRDYFPLREDFLYYGQCQIVVPAPEDRDNDAGIAYIEVGVTQGEAGPREGPFGEYHGVGHRKPYYLQSFAPGGLRLFQEFVVMA